MFTYKATAQRPRVHRYGRDQIWFMNIHIGWCYVFDFRLSKSRSLILQPSASISNTNYSCDQLRTNSTCHSGQVARIFAPPYGIVFYRPTPKMYMYA